MGDPFSLLSTLVKTKSVKNVLSPIAIQVSQLIITNEAYDRGDKEIHNSDLMPYALAVRNSVSGFTATGRKLLSGTKDAIILEQMPATCDYLEAAGENFVTASNRVQAEKFNSSSRRHMISMAREILETMLKVLLLKDDLEVRKILNCAKTCSEYLSRLMLIDDMTSLVPAFKLFTESAVKLSNLTSQREADLLDIGQREALIATVATLKRSIPMLCSSLQTWVKFPNNAQALTSKEYAVGQVIECLNDISNIVGSKNHSSRIKWDPSERPGLLVSAVDKLMSYLNEDVQSPELVISDLESEIDICIQHGMSVASFSREPYQDLIIKNCQRILHQKKRVLSQAQRANGCSRNAQAWSEYRSCCEQLTHELQDLERHLRDAVLYLVVTTFKESTEPLERLVKLALQPQYEHRKQLILPLVRSF